MLSIWLVRAVSSTAIAAAAAAAAATILDVYDSPLFVWFVFSTWKLLILLDYMLRLAIIILDNFPFFLSLCMHIYIYVFFFSVLCFALHFKITFISFTFMWTANIHVYRTNDHITICRLRRKTKSAVTLWIVCVCGSFMIEYRMQNEMFMTL